VSGDSVLVFFTFFISILVIRPRYTLFSTAQFSSLIYILNSRYIYLFVFIVKLNLLYILFLLFFLKVILIFIFYMYRLVAPSVLNIFLTKSETKQFSRIWLHTASHYYLLAIIYTYIIYTYFFFFNPKINKKNYFNKTNRWIIFLTIKY